MPDKLIRIGEKMISMQKIEKRIYKILKLRSSGLSQQEVASLLHLDRTFISRLESTGEIRRGRKIAVFGFPLKNKEEIKKISEAQGIDFIYVINEEERWNLVKNKSALNFFNEALELITKLQAYDIIVLLSSRRWLKIAEAFLGSEIIFLELGPSPIKKDCLLDLDRFRKILSKVTAGQHSCSGKEG